MDHNSTQSLSTFEENTQILNGQERRDAICQMLSARNSFFDGLFAFLLYLPGVSKEDSINQSTDMFLRTCMQLINNFLQSSNLNIDQNHLTLLRKHILFVKSQISRDSFLHTYMQHVKVAFGLTEEDPQLSHSIVDKSRIGQMSNDPQISNINNYLAESMESEQLKASLYLSSAAQRQQKMQTPTADQLSKFLNLNTQQSSLNSVDDRISNLSGVSSLGNVNYQSGNIQLRDMLQLQHQQQQQQLNFPNQLMQQNYMNPLIGSQGGPFELLRQNVDQNPSNADVSSFVNAGAILSSKQANDMQNSMNDTRIIQKPQSLNSLDAMMNCGTPTKAVGCIDDPRNLRMTNQSQNVSQNEINILLQQRQQAAHMLQMNTLPQSHRPGSGSRSTDERMYQLNPGNSQNVFQGKYTASLSHSGGAGNVQHNSEQIQIMAANNQQRALLQQRQQQLMQLAQMKQAANINQHSNAIQSSRNMQINNDMNNLSTSMQVNEMLRGNYYASQGQANAGLNPNNAVMQSQVTQISGNNNEALMRQLQHQQQMRRLSEMCSNTPNNMQINEMMLQRENMQRQLQASGDMHSLQNQVRMSNSGNISNLHPHQILQGDLTDPNNQRSFVDALNDQQNQLASTNIQNLQRANLMNNAPPIGQIQHQSANLSNMSGFNMYGTQVASKASEQNALASIKSLTPQFNSAAGIMAKGSKNYSPALSVQNLRGSFGTSDECNIIRNANQNINSSLNRELIMDPNWNESSRNILVGQSTTTPTGNLDFNLITINSPDIYMQQQLRPRNSANNIVNSGQDQTNAANLYANQMNNNNRMMNMSNRQNIMSGNTDSQNRALSQNYPHPSNIRSLNELQRLSLMNNQNGSAYDTSPQSLIPMIRNTNNGPPVSGNFFNSGPLQSSSSGRASHEENPLIQENIRKITDPRFLDRIKRECPDPDDSTTIMLKIPSGVILPLSKLNQTTAQHSFSFEVPESAYNSIIDTSCMEVTMVITNGVDECVRWPSKIKVTFNGNVFESVIRDGEYGDVPLMLKRFMVSGLNHLSISFQNESEEDPYVLLILVMNMPLSLVIPRLVHKRLMLTEWCLKENTIYINREIDALSRKYQDRDCNSMLLSLVCPVKKNIIMIPAKGENCFHVECFDLVTLLRTCHLRRVFYCPVCKQLASMENLKIDSFVWNIITEMENTNSSIVRITRDLKWFPYNNNENHHPPLSPLDMKRLMKSIKDEIIALGAAITINDNQEVHRTPPDGAKPDQDLMQSCSQLSTDSKADAEFLNSQLRDYIKNQNIRPSLSNTEMNSSLDASGGGNTSDVSSPNAVYPQFGTPKKGRQNNRKKAHKQLSRSFDNVSLNSLGMPYVDENGVEIPANTSLIRQRFSNTPVSHNISPYDMPTSPNAGGLMPANKRLSFANDNSMSIATASMIHQSSEPRSLSGSIEKLTSEQSSSSNAAHNSVLVHDYYSGDPENMQSQDITNSVEDIKQSFASQMDDSSLADSGNLSFMYSEDASNKYVDKNPQHGSNDTSNDVKDLNMSYFEFMSTNESTGSDFTNVIKSIKENITMCDSKIVTSTASSGSLNKTADESDSGCDPNARVPLHLVNDEDIFSPFGSSNRPGRGIDYADHQKNFDDFTLKTTSKLADSCSGYDMGSPSVNQSNPSSTHPELDNFLQEIMCLSGENTDFLFSVDVDDYTLGDHSIESKTKSDTTKNSTRESGT